LLPGDANIIGMTAIFSCRFHEKKTKWLLKTNKISNFMTKEASTPFLAVAASSVDQMQRSGYSFLLGDANIVGMMAIFSCNFRSS
jgi:hypothetical protein